MISILSNWDYSYFFGFSYVSISIRNENSWIDFGDFLKFSGKILENYQSFHRQFTAIRSSTHNLHCWSSSSFQQTAPSAFCHWSHLLKSTAAFCPFGRAVAGEVRTLINNCARIHTSFSYHQWRRCCTCLPPSESSPKQLVSVVATVRSPLLLQFLAEILSEAHKVTSFSLPVAFTVSHNPLPNFSTQTLTQFQNPTTQL